MRKTIPYLFLLLCLPSLAIAPAKSGEWMPVIRKGKDYALFFAVNQYDKMRPLSNPIRDAEAIAEELENQYGFDTEVVKNPTLDQIEQKLKSYRKQFAAGRYAPDGQLLVFFTGHGVVENKNGFFLAKDSDPARLYRTAWAYELWRPFINSIACKHILVSIDACYSGTFDPGWWNKSGRFARPGELSEGERLLGQHEKYTTRMFFTSATEVESPDNSNFAKKFLEGLRNRGGRDGILTSTELFTYLERANPKPHSGEFGDYDPGSSFLFILDNPLSGGSINLQETSALEQDLRAWKKAKEANTINAYQAYLRQFPNGEFRGLAIGKVQELERQAASRREGLDWEIAKEKNTKAAYQAYQQEYPGGKYYQDAGRRMKELESKARPPDNMVLIQGGSFEMGDTFGDGESNEKPVHTVTVSDFYLAIHETTFDEYDAFCDATGREKPNDRGWGRGRRPVIYVSWNDAVEYCNWRSRQEQLQEVYTISGTNVSANWNANGYRLPTEAEWEFAARQRGQKVRFGNGENTAGPKNINFNGSTNYKKPYSIAGVYRKKTVPVGSLSRPNSLGLHDMSGNVWEWCWDWYDSGYYEKSKNSRDPKGPDSGSYRVLRGGSWFYNPGYARCAHRGRDTPSLRYYSFGFRLARTGGP